MEELKKTKYRAPLVVVKDEEKPLRPVAGTKNESRDKREEESKMPEPAQRVYKARQHDPL